MKPFTGRGKEGGRWCELWLSVCVLCDWTGVVGNAVAALSLQLIVGVVLGSPDASGAGVNTWHVFTSTLHRMPVPGGLPPGEECPRLLTPSPSEILAAVPHPASQAVLSPFTNSFPPTMWLWCESHIQLIILYIAPPPLQLTLFL